MMETLPPPSRQAQVSVGEVVAFVRDGNRKEAARWLEASFKAASPLLFATDDLRRMSEAVGRGATAVNLEPSPMRCDWIYYAAIAVSLGLDNMISDSQMCDAIRMVKAERLLDDLASPLAKYVRSLEA